MAAARKPSRKRRSKPPLARKRKTSRPLKREPEQSPPLSSLSNEPRDQDVRKKSASTMKRHRPLAQTRKPLTDSNSNTNNCNTSGKSGTARRKQSNAASHSTRNTLPKSDASLEENCYEKDPIPSGYTFVRKGDVYITRNCRSKTKESARTVYVVYDRLGKRPLGLRVPSSILTSVLSSASATATTRAHAVQRRDQTHSTRARHLLQTHFPSMPPDAVEQVVNHAFLKGSRRVGRSTRRSLSDERRAGLAVEAHIRHLHTPYEELMSQGEGKGKGKGLSREEARREVWEMVLAVKKTWQGETESSMIGNTMTGDVVSELEEEDTSSSWDLSE